MGRSMWVVAGAQPGIRECGHLAGGPSDARKTLGGTGKEVGGRGAKQACNNKHPVGRY